MQVRADSAVAAIYMRATWLARLLRALLIYTLAVGTRGKRHKKRRVQPPRRQDEPEEAREVEMPPMHLTRAEMVALHEQDMEHEGEGSRMRLAWLGNSLSYFNDLPDLLKEFATSDMGGPSELAIATCVRSGGGLPSLAADGCGPMLSKGVVGAPAKNIETLLKPVHFAGWEGLGWDAVVLQDHSLHAVRPAQRATTQLVLRQKYAPLLLQTGRGGVPVRTLIFQTWGYLRAVRGSHELGQFGKKHFENMNQLAVDGTDAYRETLEQAGVPVEVVPIAEAWQIVASERRHLFSSLFSFDGHNPGVAGTYLVAAILYASISGRDPRPVRVKTCGRKDPCHNALTDADLSYLRDVAARAVTQGLGRPLTFTLEAPKQLRDLHPDL